MNGNEVPLVRAIRGPITLITIGVLFALNNFTPYRFDQTWPVILIVFGLLSLLRRGAQPWPPHSPVGGPQSGPTVGPPNWPQYTAPAGTYRQSTYSAPQPPSSGQPPAPPPGEQA
jgi:hypothetical protein